MRKRARFNGLLGLGLILVLAPALLAQTPEPQSAQAGVSLNEIVLKMEEAQLRNKESFRPYTVKREYKLFDSENAPRDPSQKPTSEVIANVNFVPPNHKSFNIEKVEGSDRGKSIVQRILENESGTKGPSPLNTENYEFALLGQGSLNGKSCWILGIDPHKEDKTTIRGKAWVDKESYLVQQVQGEIAKTPSWWIKKVETTIHYGDAGGMWLPVATYSVADVRIFGKHVLTSQAVEIKTADEAARLEPRTMNSRKTGTTRRVIPPLAGAAIYARP